MFDGLAPAGPAAPPGRRRVRATAEGSAVSRVFGEPVQVWTGGDGRPERFAWQGRVHTVRRVLDHWVRIRRSGGGPGRPGPHVSEQRFWRIDAGPEPGAGRFELCYDTLIDQWLLSRPWE